MAVDSDAGIGVGTAVTCAPGTGLDIAQPIKPTLLSLPYYAQIMGINPVHFQGAIGDPIWPVVSANCNDIWPRYSWQNADQVSHEDLARAIYDAEQEIARALGFYPAPYWIAQEVHEWPRHYRRDVWRRGGRNLRGARASIQARFGKFIQGGQRAVTPVCAASTVGLTLQYLDLDGDGFSETARINVPTDFTDPCELKVYFYDTGGVQEWEIRPARSKVISGGFLVAEFDSWLFVDPDLRSFYPTMAGFQAVDISTTANFVTTVDVYREYNDYTASAATFLWEPDPSNLLASLCGSCGGTGCPACGLSSQEGCLHVRQTDNGMVVPAPGTYNETTEQWDQDAFTECRDPDHVSLYYFAGELNDRWRSNASCEMLSNWWAHAIAWMATARLERPFCSCGNVEALAADLRIDLARNQPDRSFQLDFNMLSNPFGTRRGEMRAWLRVKKMAGRRLGGGAI